MLVTLRADVGLLEHPTVLRPLAARAVKDSAEPGSAAYQQHSAGYSFHMELEVLVKDVDEVETRSGKTRYVLRDDQGREFTTFRPQIGREAARFEGRRARIEFHEEERNGFRNVYLDAISDASPNAAGAESGTDPDEVAWSTAVEAAPWMLGSREPDEEVPPEDLYEKLEPFKRLVAEDIRGRGESPRER